MEKSLLRNCFNLFLFLILFLNYSFDSNKIELSSIVCLTLICLNLLITLSKHQIFSIKGFFIILLIIFQANYISLSYINGSSFNYVNLMSGFYLETALIFKSLLILSWVLILTGFVFFSGPQKQKNNFLKDSTITQKKYPTFFYLIIIITITSITFIRVNHIIEFGYINFFTNENVLKYSGLYSLILFFIESYLFYLLLIRKYKLKTIIFLFLLLTVSQMSDGRRGYTALNIIMLLIILYEFYGYHFSFKKIILIFTITTSSFILVSLNRTTNESINNNFIEKNIKFFAGQSDSFNIIPLVLSNKKIIDYSLFDMFGKFKRNLKNYAKIILNEKTDSNRNNLANKDKVFSAYISNKLAPNAFALGFGMGGNFIAELLVITNYNYLLFNFFAIILLFFISFVDNNFKSGNKNIFTLFISLYIGRSLIYISRNNIMDFLSELIIPLFFFITIHTFFMFKKQIN